MQLQLQFVEVRVTYKSYEAENLKYYESLEKTWFIFINF